MPFASTLTSLCLHFSIDKMIRRACPQVDLRESEFLGLQHLEQCLLVWVGIPDIAERTETAWCQQCPKEFIATHILTSGTRREPTTQHDSVTVSIDKSQQTEVMSTSNCVLRQHQHPDALQSP